MAEEIKDEKRETITNSSSSSRRVMTVPPALDMEVVKKQAAHAAAMAIVSPSHLLLSASAKPNKQANCLCSPTTHVGSFRCRYHRVGSMSRASSLSSLSDLGSKSTTHHPHLDDSLETH